jgi:polysaccharide export outer membrane protein
MSAEGAHKVTLRCFSTVFLAALAIGLAGCDSAPIADGAIATPPVDNPSQYVIGPGDVLSIFVYEAPPLSVSDLPVRS